jgi:hypothetical protein
MVSATDAHLAEGQLLCKEAAVNKGNPLNFRYEHKCQQFQARKDKM